MRRLVMAPEVKPVAMEGGGKAPCLVAIATRWVDFPLVKAPASCPNRVNLARCAGDNGSRSHMRQQHRIVWRTRGRYARAGMPLQWRTRSACPEPPKSCNASLASPTGTKWMTPMPLYLSNSK